jgi:ketosteroid isomerase-like protein
MRSSIFPALALFTWSLTTACTRPVDDFKPETIIALERAALDRWDQGDPNGYLDTYAPEVTYFDPVTEKRIDGLEAMRKYYAPLAGKIHVDRYDMLNPVVQHHGDVAVLSYNLVNYGASFDGKPEAVPHPWNSTKIYARIANEWKIVHDHWSYIKPELK